MLIAYETMRCFCELCAHAYPLVLSVHNSVSPQIGVVFRAIADTGGDINENKEKYLLVVVALFKFSRLLQSLAKSQARLLKYLKASSVTRA